MIFLGKEIPVYKAALHNHSTVSDGVFTPQELLGMYAAEKFDVFAFSDHKKTNPIHEYDSLSMTLISGIELHPLDGPHQAIWHLLALGVPQDFPGEWERAQDAVNAVNAVGGLIFCAHPAWCGITSGDIAAIKGFTGLEVYNSSCRYLGKAYSDTVWNELCDMNFFCPALAVDDTHTEAELFGGWTMVMAPERSAKSILDAIKNGMCYATQGPEFTRFEWVDDVFTVECSDVVEAVFYGQRATGLAIAMPNWPRQGDLQVINRMEKPVDRLNEEPFRCRIKDAQGRYAWSPVFYQKQQ